MNGRTAKKIRTEVKNHYANAVQEYFDVVAMMPLKFRLKIAWMIIRNKRASAA